MSAASMMYFSGGFVQTQQAASSGTASSTPAHVLEASVLVLDFLLTTHLEVARLQREGSRGARLEPLGEGHAHSMWSAAHMCCGTLQGAAGELRGFSGAVGQLLLQQGTLLRWLAGTDLLDPAVSKVLFETACCMFGTEEGPAPPAPGDSMLEPELVCKVRGARHVPPMQLRCPLSAPWMSLRCPLRHLGQCARMQLDLVCTISRDNKSVSRSTTPVTLVSFGTCVRFRPDHYMPQIVFHKCFHCNANCRPRLFAGAPICCISGAVLHAWWQVLA
jgi:hypothetical protein